MIFIVDQRLDVAEGFASWFDREGISASGLHPHDIENWVRAAPDEELQAIEAFLIGDCADRRRLPRVIRTRSTAAIIAVSDTKSLDETLELFAAGVDDVVRKPVHVRELMARITAIGHRTKKRAGSVVIGEMRVFFDGRDPEVLGEVLALPRRERRILEYLVANKGCRVTKTQIYNFVYGLFSEDIEESVIEGHISKLRKRLRQRLGYDPIDSQRYLGYRLDGASADHHPTPEPEAANAEPAPVVGPFAAAAADEPSAGRD
jgi:two-component system, OmpR family, flagellar system response regulator FtcR